VQPLLSLFPLLLVLLIFAPFAKLSALLIRRSTLSWRSALALSCFLGVIAIAGRALVYASGTVSSVAIIAVGLLAQITLGAWYLRNRVLSEARPIGWMGAAQISGLAMVLLLGTGFLFLEISRLATQLRP
jgi:hypothetical protein